MTEPTGALDLATAWDKEYAEKGIPSSWKDDPSTVLVWALENLRYLELSISPSSTVLDIGCGTGRNAIHAARHFGCRAIGLDYSITAIEQSRQRLRGQAADVRQRVKFKQSNVTSGLPGEVQDVPLALDIFVYFHLLKAEARTRYRAELARKMSQEGVLVLSLATLSDGYYASCPQQVVSDAGVRIALDEHAGVGNIMHDLRSLTAEMSDQFSLEMSWLKRKVGSMHGKDYLRETLATLWRPRHSL